MTGINDSDPAFDPLSDLCDRLVRIRVRFGDGRFREAALKAAVAVGRVALDAAEERAKARNGEARSGRGRGLWREAAPEIFVGKETDDD